MALSLQHRIESSPIESVKLGSDKGLGFVRDEKKMRRKQKNNVDKIKR